MLSEEKVTWFQEQYKKYIGKEINREDARKLGEEMYEMADICMQHYYDMKKSGKLEQIYPREELHGFLAEKEKSV